MGCLTFKNCKRIAPLQKFQYRKFLKVDTVTANRKFFNDYPHLAEFAKPFLPPGYASEVRKTHEDAVKEHQDEIKRQQEAKKNKQQPQKNI